jgi:hypothetical protein
MTEIPLILQYEQATARESTKLAGGDPSEVEITEMNSILLAQILLFNPEGPCRDPTQEFLSSFRRSSLQLNLSGLLAGCREPDFLIQVDSPNTR